MNAALLLQWHYLIFLVPFGLSAFLLLLSTLRFGGHHAGHSGHGHAAVHSVSHAHTLTTHAGHSLPGAHGSAARIGEHGHANPRGHVQNHAKSGTKEGVTQANMLAGLFGLQRAPLPMVIQAFFLVWGLAGCIVNQLLVKGSPTTGQMLPVMGIAAGFGLVGARVAAELIGRLMPSEESLVVSREGLFGLKGKVAFPVSETGGRIMVYDDFGSLHDESCRVVTGHPPIERGRKVMVMDRDAQGNLLVEEIAE